jgi:hypothetical protein
VIISERKTFKIDRVEKYPAAMKLPNHDLPKINEPISI